MKINNKGVVGSVLDKENLVMEEFDNQLEREKGQSKENDNLEVVADSVTLFSKIDQLMTKLALYKMREILIQEKSKGYYRKAINVIEKIEIAREKCIDCNGVEYDKVQYIVYWDNGFYELNTKNEFQFLVKKRMNNRVEK